MKRHGVFTLLALVVIVMFIVPHVGRLFYPLDHRDLIRVNAWRHDLDPALVAAVIRVESGFDPMAESRKGAIGLMQIMPETGAWVAAQMGLEDFETTDLFDPATNIRIGTWYLADLLHVFEGDLELALAAYNGGRGTVRRWLESAGVADYSGRSAALTLDQFPFAETRRFVRRVMLSYRMYQLLYPDSHRGGESSRAVAE